MVPFSILYYLAITVEFVHKIPKCDHIALLYKKALTFETEPMTS